MIHNEYMQDNLRINRQERQKIKEISQQCTPATHTKALCHQGGTLVSFH